MTDSGSPGFESYLSIARPATAEIEVKHSRFVALVHPVNSEKAARAVVENQRRAHHGARHHCSAFILGPASDNSGVLVERSSDDGEPSGTAGMPMLDVLRGNGFADLIAVVTRYFGGTLLGAGGLVRAYSDAVSAACELATPVQRRRLLLFDLPLDHAGAGRVEAELRNRGVTINGVSYAQFATLTLAVPSTETASLTAAVASITGGTGRLTPAGVAWVDSVES